MVAVAVETGMTDHSPSRSPFDTKSPVDRDAPQKIAATCTACASAYAAEKLSNGTIRLIGRPDGCGCGNSQFEEISSESEIQPAQSD